MTNLVDHPHPAVAATTRDLPGSTPLSAREDQMLRLITQGCTNQQIAEVLLIGVDTVKTHIRSLYRKIEAPSRAHAIVWGARNGYLDGHQAASTD